MSYLQANWLKAQGIKKGDAVAIYMPMTCKAPPSLPCACLRCAHLHVEQQQQQQHTQALEAQQ